MAVEPTAILFSLDCIIFSKLDNILPNEGKICALI
jgi:hypothetical protein